MPKVNVAARSIGIFTNFDKNSIVIQNYIVIVKSYYKCDEEEWCFTFSSPLNKWHSRVTNKTDYDYILHTSI